MSRTVIRTKKLSKLYGNQRALDYVDLAVPEGAIYGFIGQNGAGKSTLLRTVVGLAAPSGGTVELFGASGDRELAKARKRIGIMIEAPALYPHMTAAENLEVHRLLRGIPGKDCIRRTLAKVGLEDTKNKKAKHFSLGMKQRLGMALALLGDPEVLILDEPINGLDPMGVVEIRELLMKLNREQGISILISSHILSELHLLATHYGFIHKGRLLEQLTTAKLGEKCRQYLHVKVDQPEQAAALLETTLATTDFEVLPEGVIKLYSYLDAPKTVSAALARSGIMIEQFMVRGESLEDYFSSLVGGDLHG